jgi:hypothetical protein
MMHKSDLIREVDRRQYWTTADPHVYKVFNTRSGCEEDSFDVRELLQFSEWKRAIDVAPPALYDTRSALMAAASMRATDDADLYRCLVENVMKAYLQAREERNLALEVLAGNGFSFDEAFRMLRPIQ